MVPGREFQSFAIFYIMQVLDLSGDREPLTKETAEETLAPLLAANASITTVLATPCDLIS